MHQSHPDPLIDRRIRDSLVFSVLDAAFSSAMVGFSESYFQAFAVHLKASTIQVGIIYSIPMFLGSLMPLLSGAFLTCMRSRKSLNVWVGAFRTLLFVPLMFTERLGPGRFWVLLAIISLYFSCNYLGNPAWTSWMGEMVSEEARGRFFARRNRVGNLVALIGVVAAGLILEALAARASLGYLIIFAAGLLGSLLSVSFLAMKVDLPCREVPRVWEGFWDFSHRMHSSSYGKYVLLNLLFYFAVFLSGPYFVPYMLNVLKFSYAQFMVATAIVVLVKFLFMPLWGEMGDRYGNRKTLNLSILIITVVPLLWLVSRSFWWLLAAQVVSGIGWAGFDIATLNYAYDTTSPEDRVRNTAYLMLYRGIGIFLAGLAGSLIVNHFRFRGSPFLGIFLVSSLSRLVLAGPLLPFIREARAVEHISYRDLMLALVSLGPRRGIQEFLVGIQRVAGNRGGRTPTG